MNPKPRLSKPYRTRCLTFAVAFAVAVCLYTISGTANSHACADEPDIADPVLTVNDPDVPGSGNYVIMPITTELQRHYYRNNEDAKAFVFVNAMDPVSENGAVLNVAAIDIDSMMESLKPIAESDSSATVIFSIRTRDKPLNQRAAGVLSRALPTEARLAGFREGQYDFRRFEETSKYYNNWKGFVADLCVPPLQAEIDAETGVSDEEVTVFAVHTPLSKMLYGGDFEFPIDCVVFIKSPIEEADILEKVEEAVAKLTFKTKHRICFEFHAKEANSAESIGALNELTDLAFVRNRLGFKTYTYHHWNMPLFDALKAQRESQESTTSTKNNDQ